MFGTSFSSDPARQGEDEADLPHPRRIWGTVAFYGATQRSNASPLEGAKPRELQQICQWSERGMQQVHKKLLYTFFLIFPLDMVGYDIIVVNCCLQEYVISTNLEITIMLHNSCCLFAEWEIECMPPFDFGNQSSCTGVATTPGRAEIIDGLYSCTSSSAWCRQPWALFANGAGVLWEQDADPTWQICLDCEQGAVHKNGGQWWVHVRTVMTSFSLSQFSRYCSCSLSCQVMHKLHFCKIQMLIQCHRNDSDMKISRSKQVQWKNWNDRME